MISAMWLEIGGAIEIAPPGGDGEGDSLTSFGPFDVAVKIPLLALTSLCTPTALEFMNHLISESEESVSLPDFRLVFLWNFGVSFWYMFGGN